MTKTIIELPKFTLEQYKFHIIGTAMLVVHAFTEKARKQMLDKQMKVAKGGRDARDPEQELADATYVLPDGRHGFPAIAFKAAAVTACTQLSDVTKTAARQAFTVAGLPMKAPGVLENSFQRTSLVPLVSPPPIRGEATVRLSGVGRTVELRYRPAYDPWGVELDVTLNPQVISVSQLGSMFQAAGHGVGVGEYRPERNGDCGTFALVSAEEFAEWKRKHKL